MDIAWGHAAASLEASPYALGPIPVYPYWGRFPYSDFHYFSEATVLFVLDNHGLQDLEPPMLRNYYVVQQEYQWTLPWRTNSAGKPIWEPLGTDSIMRSVYQREGRWYAEIRSQKAGAKEIDLISRHPDWFPILECEDAETETGTAGGRGIRMRWPSRGSD